MRKGADIVIELPTETIDGRNEYDRIRTTSEGRIGSGDNEKDAQTILDGRKLAEPKGKGPAQPSTSLEPESSLAAEPEYEWVRPKGNRRRGKSPSGILKYLAGVGPENTT